MARSGAAAAIRIGDPGEGGYGEVVADSLLVAVTIAVLVRLVAWGGNHLPGTSAPALED